MPCHEVFDAYHVCMTHNKLGKLNDLDEKGKQYFRNFSKCFYHDLNQLGRCRKYYDDIIRY